MDRLMPRSAQVRKIAAVDASARSQASHVVLLRADMERDAVRHQPALVRELQDIGGIVRLAAELARQRPFGAGAVAMDAADHPAAGSSARHLLDLGLAVDGEQRDAELERGRDLALLLDGVAVGDAVGRGAGGEHVVRLGHRGDVEATAEPGQELEDFRRRIGLDGVEHLGVRQHLGEVQVVLAHDIEVEDEAGSVFSAML